MTLLPVDIFRAELGMHPYHFWGMSDQRYTPINSNCSKLVYEYDWQGSDAAGRESVRRAIRDAEWKLHQYLQFWPAPKYVETEALPWPRYGDAAQVRYADMDATGRRVAMNAPDFYVQRMGIEQLTLIDTPAVVLTALGAGQPYYTFTLTLTGTVPSGATADELAVYFAAADRLDDDMDRWRIEPVEIEVSGTNATITGRAWLLVVPSSYIGFGIQSLDPTDINTFVSTLDVYRRTTNGDGTSVTTSQATLIYETNDCGQCWGRCCCSTGTTSSDPGTIGEVIARAGIRDSRLGLVTPAAAIYNPDTGLWQSEWCCASSYCDPDRVKLRYLAGVPLVNGAMDPKWQSIVVKLAAAELKRRICACRDTNERLHDLQMDMALESTTTERYRRTEQQMNNPFGTRLGHIQAWLDCKDNVSRHGYLS